MLLLIWTLAIIGVVVLFFRHKYSRFKNAGVNYLTPIAPFGNLIWSTLKMEHISYSIQRIYEALPNDRFVGAFEFHSPVVMVKDLDLIKKISLKDFDHFTDHRVFIAEDNDALFGRNLFSLKGSKWREMRSTLSPAFTSSKIKLMVPFMIEVSEQMNRVLREKIENSQGNYIDLDTRDLTTRYANDVIASCAFGMKVNSHVEETNEFYIKGRDASNFTFWQILKFLGFNSMPNIMNFFKISLLRETTKVYFRSLVTSVMNNRKEQNIIRPDMIHLLMEAKKGRLTHDDQSPDDKAAGFATVEESTVGKVKVTTEWSDDDLIAQALLFFIAGFETVSSVMTFMLYELAVNPEIQDKLVEEIKLVDEKNKGKIDLNSIQQMMYMDMVVSETLRKWPAVSFLDRICTADYNMGKPHSKATKDFIIRKGEGVWIPAWPIHRNPEYYPNPEKFDPERFSEENSHRINPFMYVPFGLGPRNCIGSRFALCEVKVMVYRLLKDIAVSPSEKTPIPATLSTESFNMRIKGGHWLRYRIRN